MTKKKKLIIVGILLLAGISALRYHNKSQSIQPDITWVQTTKVTESSLPVDVSAIGTLVARSVEITPEVAGHVEKIFFKDGQFVKSGTALIQLDDTIYKAKDASTQADLNYKENNFKRMRLLAKKGIVSQDAMDQAQAVLTQKRAEAKESHAMLSKMQLTAPFDGVLGKGKMNSGDYVNLGQNLVTLTDTHHLRVEYNVPEKYLPLLKLGQMINVTSVSYPGKVFSGKLSFISPTITAENRSIALYAEINNEDELLKPGMFVNVMQSLGMEDHSLMVPMRSLVPVLEGSQIYKVIDGKAQAVNVSIGKRTKNEVQVVEGLSVGDEVITDGQFKIRNGMPVKVKT